jgi:nitrogen fixation NifU-like protein
VANYPEFLIDHFMNPRNTGEIFDPDGVATVANGQCGDIMQVFIKVNDNRITEVKFKAFGCGATIATSSILTERVKGTTLDEALKISQRTLREILPQLPREKVPCSLLATDALKIAIEEHRCRDSGIQRRSGFDEREMKREEDENL